MHSSSSRVVLALSLVLAPTVVGQDDPWLPAQVVDQALRDGVESDAAARVVAAGSRSVPILVSRLRAAAAAEDAAKAMAGLGLLRRIGAPGGDAALELLDRERPLPPSAIGDLVLTIGEVGPFAKFDGRAEREAFVHDLFGYVAVDFSERVATDSPEYLAAMAAVYRAKTRLRVDPESPIERLLALIIADVTYSREFAAELLGKRGEAIALPRLASALREQNATVGVRGEDWIEVRGAVPDTDRFHDAVATAILRIAPRSAEACGAHAHRLRAAESARDRVHAARQLMELGLERGAAATVPALMAGLEDRDWSVVAEAVTALGAFGEKAAAAKPRLERLAADEDERIAARARAALHRIGGSGSV